MVKHSKKAEQLLLDPTVSAKRAGLIYTTDQTPGITRRLKGESFEYIYPNGKLCKDKATLKRIHSLVIPPAWEKVWICPDADGHLQATGFDQKGRKQYRYHPDWNAVRSETKFHRLHLFAEHLPAIRKKVNEDLASPGITYRKVLALIVRLLEYTNIRIGNDEYRKLYGSFGLTTLRDRHVKIEGTKTTFSFKGKKGVEHQIALQSRRLTQLIKQCRDIPGYELFQYYDEQGQRQNIGSSDVNNYLKEITQDSFTAKDFRTWAGTLQAFRTCCSLGEFTSAAEAKKNVVQVIEEVAQKLGNTRAVCKKYYIHPHILESYETGVLCDYFGKVSESGEITEELSEVETLVKDLLVKGMKKK
ncbi:DNA topoisomerase IB [Cytophagaceae bacterium DM2B3-1]|uniref:DNA topoisomerase n=1 Tax=Xanthocytophaga flava TaxID=3048013 RepID=A0ABT7CGF9_9BACT|nr:DNA topoisomerase IB [Xanthocytophaga flavus]MDJ1492732.1 DNA topoisomerase IB [Xanthocytophaga flavus]